MKIRFLLILAGLAFPFAAPVLAQEQNTVDPEVRQQIEALLMKYEEAYNKSDAAGTASLYSQDGIAVLSGVGRWRDIRPASHREKGRSRVRVKSGEAIIQAC
jgi:hypothetical protein